MGGIQKTYLFVLWVNQGGAGGLSARSKNTNFEALKVALNSLLNFRFLPNMKHFNWTKLIDIGRETNVIFMPFIYAFSILGAMYGICDKNLTVIRVFILWRFI